MLQIFLSYWPSTSKKKATKRDINQQLEALYTGHDKANVVNHFVSVLKVCDIDKKYISFLLIKMFRQYVSECDMLRTTVDS